MSPFVLDFSGQMTEQLVWAWAGGHHLATTLLSCQGNVHCNEVRAPTSTLFINGMFYRLHMTNKLPFTSDFYSLPLLCDSISTPEET
jgi:hypothetical protein